jgi:hypothetical protein
MGCTAFRMLIRYYILYIYILYIYIYIYIYIYRYGRSITSMYIYYSLKHIDILRQSGVNERILECRRLRNLVSCRSPLIAAAGVHLIHGQQHI